MQSLLFLKKILLFSSNSTVSSVEIPQMLRSIEFPLRSIGLDGHKSGMFAIFKELFLTVYVLCMSTLNIITA